MRNCSFSFLVYHIIYGLGNFIIYPLSWEHFEKGKSILYNFSVIISLNQEDPNQIRVYAQSIYIKMPVLSYFGVAFLKWPPGSLWMVESVCNARWWVEAFSHAFKTLTSGWSSEVGTRNHSASWPVICRAHKVMPGRQWKPQYSPRP